MAALALLWLMFAGPFWQEKKPVDWTDIEVSQLFAESPWAATVGPPSRNAAAPSVQVYIATAGPMLAAEKERERRLKARRKPGEPEKDDPLAEEYRLWLEDNLASQVVLAIRLNPNAQLSQESEVRHLEEESFMQVGKKKFKMTGHFPPTPTDPYLRLAFPRPDMVDEKTALTFSFYAPGLPLPFREVQFRVKDLMVNGKAEF
jgi:hypothetical protein